MSQHPEGGERAHLNVEPRVVGDDADASDESAHERLSVFKADALAKDNPPN